ncbi:hypothetical protein M0R19_04770 [Candidatus Pacearchaeota archaeon]|jgi:RNase P subunit RPR2|nr:hypothetical protein [Candidatus Pacearchaeota archaeon]
MSCPTCKNSIESLIPTGNKIIHQSGTKEIDYKCRSCGAIWRCTVYQPGEHAPYDLDHTEHISWSLLKN